ncbi:amidohydrolase family protein [Sporosarcina sp. E16_3]|uniref:amidohydrolase family protein n=1 Tax=Sporosarcina sp. E16_3 TaxID=2789293 RepID=UPI001A917B1D|nr:amidohydrolase family protein [Sporosarcina sp. E16_3]MBO0600645.1 amidohydrolase family protein [Sporosarcina sp. E16_3]
MRIDAHQHFWKLSKNLNDWPTSDSKAIYRDFTPADLEEHLKKHDIHKTVTIQAAPFVEETKFLLDLADQHEFIGGVVGWIDMSSKQFPELFTEFRNHPKFVGIRPMLQNLKDDQWILQPEVKRNISILIEHDFPIDILIYPKHLPHIVTLLKEFPSLRAVIDHCAKPAIQNRQWAPWADLIEQFSEFESVMCKISGLVTEADHHSWETDEFRPYIHHLINCFGTERVMFGSDWPVCLLAAQYDEVVEIITSNLPEEMTMKDKKLLYGGNAQKFYRL